MANKMEWNEMRAEERRAAPKNIELNHMKTWRSDRENEQNEPFSIRTIIDERREVNFPDELFFSFFVLVFVFLFFFFAVVPFIVA